MGPTVVILGDQGALGWPVVITTWADTGGWCVGSWQGWWRALVTLEPVDLLQAPARPLEFGGPTTLSSCTKPKATLVSCSHRPRLPCSFALWPLWLAGHDLSIRPVLVFRGPLICWVRGFLRNGWMDHVRIHFSPPFWVSGARDQWVSPRSALPHGLDMALGAGYLAPQLVTH